MTNTKKTPAAENYTVVCIREFGSGRKRISFLSRISGNFGGSGRSSSLVFKMASSTKRAASWKTAAGAAKHLREDFIDERNDAIVTYHVVTLSELAHLRSISETFRPYRIFTAGI